MPEPDSVELRGTVPAAEFRARLRRARAFVHGARWEDWGQAPLEALADGALLATVPSGGPYEALRVARLLEPELVAPAVDPNDAGKALHRVYTAIDSVPGCEITPVEIDVTEPTNPIARAAIAAGSWRIMSIR